MIDAAKLLGGLLNSGMGGGTGNIGGLGNLGRQLGRGSGLGGVNKAAVGMGLLGVAFAAFDHFSKGQKATPQTAMPPQAPQPPMPPSVGATPSAPPPPPPAASSPEPAQSVQNNEAELIIQAMVAAAAADGVIDEQERSAVLKQLENIDGIGDEEYQFLQEQMDSPSTIDQLASACQGKEQALRLYITALMTITVDTDIERQWLQQFATALSLQGNDLKQIHAQFLSH